MCFSVSFLLYFFLYLISPPHFFTPLLNLFSLPPFPHLFFRSWSAQACSLSSVLSSWSYLLPLDFSHRPTEDQSWSVRTRTPSIQLEPFLPPSYPSLFLCVPSFLLSSFLPFFHLILSPTSVFTPPSPPPLSPPLFTLLPFPLPSTFAHPHLLFLFLRNVASFCSHGSLRRIHLRQTVQNIQRYLRTHVNTRTYAVYGSMCTVHGCLSMTFDGM